VVLSCVAGFDAYFHPVVFVDEGNAREFDRYVNSCLVDVKAALVELPNGFDRHTVTRVEGIYRVERSLLG
jgi:hypothetical protein